MELQSFTVLKTAPRKIADLLNIDGAIRSVIVISAYIDMDTINAILRHVDKRRDDRTSPQLWVYTDYSSSGFTTNPDRRKEINAFNKRLQRQGFSEDSGIYLIKTGNLFHSKCYLVRGNNQQRLILGSLNATQAGLTKNEEIIVNGVTSIDSRSQLANLADWVEGTYLPELDENALRATEDLEEKFSPTNLRQILLDGWIYYEIKEQDPFRFSLNLPEEITELKSDIHPLLSAKLVDSLSVINLASGSQQIGGLGHEFPERQSSKESWKRHCLETCYGFWSPSVYDSALSKVLESRYEAREPYYAAIRDFLIRSQDQLTERFTAFASSMNSAIKQANPDAVWRPFEEETLVASWDRWFKLMKEKLENEDYFGRIIYGIDWATVPDVWNDPIASREFEDSFLDSLKYHWSKSYRQNTQRVVARNIAKNLNLDFQAEDDISNTKLKSAIERWCKANKGRSLFLQ